MKPISKKTMTPEELDLALNALLLKIEGKNSSDSRTEKTQEKNQQAASGSSGSVSAPTTPRLASGTKTTEKDALAFDGSKVNGDPHTTPIKRAKPVRQINIKTEVMRRPKKSSDEEQSSSSTTPRSVRFATSDSTTSVSNRSAAPTPTSTPMPIPAATPRTAAVRKEDSSSESSSQSKNKSPRTTQFRKTVSKGFSRAALNISKFGEKLSSHVASISTSTLATPKSSGRNSPEAHSSTRSSEKNNPYPEITPSIKNQAARALLKLQSDEDYKNNTEAINKITLLGALVEILNANKIEIEPRKLKMLQEETLERSKFSVVDAEIDIQTEPYVGSVMSTLKYIESMWGMEKGDRGDKYLAMIESEKKEADLCFIPMFLRDENSGFMHYKIEQADGSYKDVSSLAELADFLNQDDPESIAVRKNGEIRNQDGVLIDSLRSKYISLFTCQFISNEIGNLGFAINPTTPSVIRLYDGTPLSPSGMTNTTWSYSKTSDGGIKVKLLIERNPGSGKLSKLKNENETKIEIDDGATATIETELYFSAARDLRIGNLKVHATGWNLPKDM